MNKYTKRNQFAGLATVLMAAFPMNALAQDAISFLMKPIRRCAAPVPSSSSW